MITPIETHARITRTRPNSPTLSLTHPNHCAATDGGRCTCGDARWELREPPAPKKGKVR